MATAITDVPVNLLDELNKINDLIDVIAPCMHEEELCIIDECLCRLEAFIHLLPRDVQDEVLNSSKYLFVVRGLLTNWSETISPLNGWPPDLVARLH